MQTHQRAIAAFSEHSTTAASNADRLRSKRSFVVSSAASLQAKSESFTQFDEIGSNSMILLAIGVHTAMPSEDRTFTFRSRRTSFRLSRTIYLISIHIWLSFAK